MHCLEQQYTAIQKIKYNCISNTIHYIKYVKNTIQITNIQQDTSYTTLKYNIPKVDVVCDESSRPPRGGDALADRVAASRVALTRQEMKREVSDL